MDWRKALYNVLKGASISGAIGTLLVLVMGGWAINRILTTDWEPEPGWIQRGFGIVVFFIVWGMIIGPAFTHIRHDLSVTMSLLLRLSLILFMVIGTASLILFGTLIGDVAIDGGVWFLVALVSLMGGMYCSIYHFKGSKKEREHKQ